MFSSIKPFGNSALLIEWEQSIKIETLNEITQLNEIIRKAELHGVIETIPAYASLTVFFQPEKTTFETLKDIISLRKDSDFEITTESSKLWEIPVKYGNTFKNDLSLYLEIVGISMTELVHLHSERVYDIYFMGFLPGFMYLGGLDEKLSVPRKQTPDLKIPAGSVAIGGRQTGIYPQESPGGWYVIGNTDFVCVDYTKNPITPLKAGDKVRFVPI